MGAAVERLRPMQRVIACRTTFKLELIRGSRVSCHTRIVANKTDGFFRGARVEQGIRAACCPPAGRFCACRRRRALQGRGGDIAWTMATTSNAAMRKKTPFHVSIFLGRDTSNVLGMGQRRGAKRAITFFCCARKSSPALASPVLLRSAFREIPGWGKMKNRLRTVRRA